MRISDWSSDVCSSDLKRIFAPDQIAKPAKEKRAERAHRKAGGKGGERKDEAGGFVDPRKKLFRDDRREQAVEVEIIPFEDGAERRSQNHLAFALPRLCRPCRVVRHSPLPFAGSGPSQHRSEERRVGKEWFSTFRSRWSP